MGQKIPRRFEFGRDTFAFANQLVWEYQFDANGQMTIRDREPKPDYAHRCFVLTRAARQFLYHAEFRPEEKPVDENGYRRLVRQVLSRDPRAVGDQPVIIPGFPGLRQFSAAHERLLKVECGGAWRSYVLRSHWRMLFPFSRGHQERTAHAMRSRIQASFSPIIHLVNFPSLNINHGMILYDVVDRDGQVEFLAYDPNLPAGPARLSFDRGTRTFYLPRNSYWFGGNLNIIEIFRNWIL